MDALLKINSKMNKDKVPKFFKIEVGKHFKKNYKIKPEVVVMVMEI